MVRIYMSLQPLYFSPTHETFESQILYTGLLNLALSLVARDRKTSQAHKPHRNTARGAVCGRGATGRARGRG